MPLVNDTVGGRGGRGGRERGRGRGTATSRSKNKGGSEAPDTVFIVEDARLSTQDNKDPLYTEIGVVHTSESVAINIVRGTVTDVFNIVGLSGFNNTLFDTARHNCLVNMLAKLNNLKSSSGRDLKISNIRFEAITVDPTLITMNAYGTFLVKKAAEQVAPAQK
jgi:hypothetical protein